MLAGTLLVSATLPALAAGRLDPASAEKTTQDLFHGSGYTFCTQPPHPLGVRAEEVCPLATQAVGCDALVRECSAQPTKPPELSPFWARLGSFIVAIAPYVAWTVVGVFLLLVIYLIYRAVRASQEDSVPELPVAAGDVVVLPEPTGGEPASAAELLLRRAAELHARGDERTALFTYLAAALRALDERGAVRIKEDRTNGEYVRACREAPMRPPLREIVREVDFVQFGGNDATAGAVERAAARAEAIVRAPPAPPIPSFATLALMLIVLLLAGCDGNLRPRNDPAGRDLIADLLSKQGAHISTLAGSLGTLPMKGTASPALILDVERVPLEEDTKAHLVAWVKQGGTIVIAGGPHLWPSDFWAKPLPAEGTVVRVQTSGPAHLQKDDEDDDEEAAPVRAAPPRVDHATLARPAAMTWPSEDHAPRAIARLPSGELYAALRDFGDGKILGLASAELFTNLGLVVPGNAAAVIALLSTLDKDDFAIVRVEQGISPPANPFAGLLRIGLGLALAHALVFIPLLLLAFGARRVAPTPEPAPRRRAFAEHVRAVGALYARRRAASHSLAVFAKHVDDRVRAKMPRGSDPAHFLASRSGRSSDEMTALYARAMAARTGGATRGDELVVLESLSAAYHKALDQA